MVLFDCGISSDKRLWRLFNFEVFRYDAYYRAVLKMLALISKQRKQIALTFKTLTLQMKFRKMKNIFIFPLFAYLLHMPLGLGNDKILENFNKSPFRSVTLIRGAVFIRVNTVYLHVQLFSFLNIFICLFIYLFICLFIYLLIYLFI